MSSRSRIRDINNVPKVIKIIDELNSMELHIGVFSEDDSHMAMIATVNEYGMNINVTDKMRAYLHANGIHLAKSTTQVKIPERSFVRKGFDSNQGEFERMAKGLLPSVFKGNISPDKFYKLLGEFIVGKIHKQIQQTTSPPNHPATIAGKGSAHPLIDSGRLNQSITYKVVRSGGI